MTLAATVEPRWAWWAREGLGMRAGPPWLPLPVPSSPWCPSAPQWLELKGCCGLHLHRTHVACSPSLSLCQLSTLGGVE